MYTDRIALKKLSSYIFTGIFLVFFHLAAHAQLPLPRLGFSFRPVIPSGLFDNTELEVQQGPVKFSIDPKPGYAIGVSFRQELPYLLSFESGIHFVRRAYDLHISDTGFSTTNKFRFITYEIPFNGLIYIRLSENTYLNNAFGLTLDFVPSNVFTENEYYLQKVQRKYWVLPGLNAETGWEYRTEKSGIFYVGGSYHRMLVRLADTRIAYTRGPINEDITTKLSGHYFALDFRYFFPTQRTAPIEWDY